MATMSQSALCVAAGSAMSLCSCWTGQGGVVRDRASLDLSCSESAIEVTRLSPVLKKDELTLSSRSVYRVDGCGHRLFYVCDGWDSYAQKSLCEASAHP